MTASQHPESQPSQKVSGASRPETLFISLLLQIYQESEKLARNTLKCER